MKTIFYTILGEKTFGWKKNTIAGRCVPAAQTIDVRTDVPIPLPETLRPMGSGREGWRPERRCSRVPEGVELVCLKGPETRDQTRRWQLAELVAEGLLFGLRFLEKQMSS